MATGKAGWYVVWQGRKVGMVHANGTPVYRFHKGPYRTQGDAHIAGLALLRKLTAKRKRNPGERIAARDVLAERNHNGSWTVSVVKDGQHHRMTYYGYAKRDAIATFLRDIKKGGERLMGHQLRNPGTKRPRRTKRRQGLLRDMRSFGLGRGAGIVGETARVALDLTRAQRKARELGWEYEFIPEEERYEDVYGEPAPAGAEFVTVVLKDRRGNVLASLGFVDYNDTGYIKQVQAELASEALHEGRHRAPVYRGTHSPNPALTGFQQVGPNQAEVAHGQLRVLYSYNTPVAVIDIEKHVAYRTEQHFSNTSTKHTNKWLRAWGYALKGPNVVYVPQHKIADAVRDGRAPVGV